MLTIGYNYGHDVSSRSVKTVRTNIFAKNCKLHKLATIPIIFKFKNQLLQTCITIKRTCLSMFSKLGLVDQSSSAH